MTRGATVTAKARLPPRPQQPRETRFHGQHQALDEGQPFDADDVVVAATTAASSTETIEAMSATASTTTTLIVLMHLESARPA